MAQVENGRPGGKKKNMKEVEKTNEENLVL
jgi:hypothetical protein